MNKVETIITVYFCIRVLFAYSLKENHYIQWKQYLFHSNTRAIGHDNSRSIVHCMVKCSVTPACVAAKFDPTNGDCEFHQVYNVHTPIMMVHENSSVVVVKSERGRIYQGENNYSNMTFFKCFDNTHVVKCEDIVLAVLIELPHDIYFFMNELPDVIERRQLHVNVLNGSWMKYGALDCYIGSSHDYTGTHSKTVSNRECQGWNTNYPHTVNEKPVNQDDHSTNYCRATSSDGLLWCYTTDNEYRWEYCPIIPCFACGVFESPPSEPPNTTSAVSITNVVLVTFQCLSVTLGKSFEHCPVSSCGSDDQWSSMYNISCTSEDCYTKSTEYVGKVHCTVSGITCQHWNTDIHHQSNYRPTDPTDLASNYCRDPSSDGRPWCYTTHPDVRWEFCPVPHCTE